MENEPRIVIAGCGGLGAEVEAFLRSKNVNVHRWIDDTNPTVSSIDDYVAMPREEVVVCIGDPRGRENVVAKLTERKAQFHGVLFHWAAFSAHIGGGCIAFPGSKVSAHANVGDFCHIGFDSLVGHHVTLGAYCSLSSQVDLCGHVEVGHGVFFGSGARVLPRVKIGDYATIGAGAVVVKDVAAGTTVFGNPAVRVSL